MVIRFLSSASKTSSTGGPDGLIKSSASTRTTEISTRAYDTTSETYTIGQTPKTPVFTFDTTETYTFFMTYTFAYSTREKTTRIESDSKLLSSIKSPIYKTVSSDQTVSTTVPFTTQHATLIETTTNTDTAMVDGASELKLLSGLCYLHFSITLALCIALQRTT